MENDLETPDSRKNQFSITMKNKWTGNPLTFSGSINAEHRKFHEIVKVDDFTKTLLYLYQT